MAKEVLRLELINVQLLVLCYDYIVRDGKVYVHLSNQVGFKKMYQRAFDNFTSRVAIRKLQKNCRFCNAWCSIGLAGS